MRGVPMSKRLRATILTATLQYGAFALGCMPALRWYHWFDIAPLPAAVLLGCLLQPEILGILAATAFFAETIRRYASSPLQKRDVAIAWLCLSLLIYVGWFMAGGVSLEFDDSNRFVIQMHLLLPFLLAIGPLVRSRAWFGVAGAVMFYVAALSIVVGNGFFWRSGKGFFYRLIS